MRRFADLIPLDRVSSRTRWWLVVLALVIIVTGLGTATAVGVAGATSPTALQSWANVGQAFGALSAVTATAAFAAVVFTFFVQQAELRQQRSELEAQSQALHRTREELHCAAETGLSRLHLELIRLSIDRPHLAEVWPLSQLDLPDEELQQYLFCTLVFESIWLHCRTGRYRESDVRAQIRYHFTSPAFRRYWAATMDKRRAAVTDDGPESNFFRIATEIYESLDD